MRRFFCVAILLLSLTSVGCPPAPKDDPVKPEDIKVKPPPVKSPDHLQGRIEAALQQVRERDLLTTHAFWTVFHGILGLGLDNAMLTYPDTRKKVRAIDYICDGGEIRGLKFVPTKDGLDVEDVRTRPDLEGVAQGHQDQFVAEMTEWGMKKDRKFHVAGRDYTFADFARKSKMRASVKKQQELSWAIIVIGQFYGTGDEPWINSHGETLTYHDIVRYELDAPIDEAACGGTHRLFGLTWAYHLHLKNGGKSDGLWHDLETKIATYKARAKEIQNRRTGAFSTDYFKGNENADSLEKRVGTTGHIVEWLALAMTDEELRSAWMQNAVNALALAMLDLGEQPVESGALYHAAHGLYLYRERVYGAPPAYLPLLPKQ